ncbi:MAG: LPS-assembly protein LptD [Prevotella sp.]|nr:LPS-assembly protein LptD [Prevotella sp.]
MKQKSTIIVILCAFILMMACTPGGLRREKPLEAAAKDAASVSLPKINVPDIKVKTNTDSLTLPALIDSIGAKQVVEEIKETLDVAPADTVVTSEKQDTPADTTSIPEGATSAIKMKRDTTQMDSLELAIYKHNKAVDDSLALDSINKKRKNGIDAPVEYSADDSLTYDAVSATAHLYGNSKVKYTNMDLASEKIYMSLDSNLVHASGKLDSTTNKMLGTPVFKMGSDEYQQQEMSFNFKTKKGFITDVYTQQEDGYLTSEKSKRGGNGEMFLEHGRYTTCDDPHPDFYIAMSRAKVRPGKDVVFGPAYLVVADVPLPLAIPYGFFPFTKSYSSGFIMPTYGDEMSKGFYLRDGGYYFAISDKMDLKLLGEIYTKGSWGLKATSNYKKRYKYNGTFFVSYLSSVNGEKNTRDYSKTTEFKVQWSHKQDSKANPFSNFGASVNFATSGFESNNLASMYNPQARTQSQRTSSINYNTGFSSLGMTITSTMNLNQNMNDTTITMLFPDVNINVNRFYPFKRKKMAGKERWYEKINLSYTGHFSNTLTAKESEFLKKKLNKDWKNGMTHTIPIKGEFSVFDVLNLNTSFTLNDRTTLVKQEKSWDQVNQKEITDTISGFYNVYNWDLSLGLSTTLYGMFIPSRKIFGDKIQAIRHVLKPTVSFSYHPDFGAERYGYYKTYDKIDKDGKVTQVEYQPYSLGYTTSVGKGKSGSISVSIDNNVEMKIKDKNDSIKKVSLIDNLGLSMSYNFATNIQPLSPLTMNIRLKLSKSYTFSTTAVFKSYVYELDDNGNPRESNTVTYWEKGQWGRFQGISQQLHYKLDNKKIGDFFKRLRGEKVDKKDDKNKNGQEEDEEGIDTDIESNIDKDMVRSRKGGNNQTKSKAETDDDGYMAFKLPWSLDFSYGVNMTEGNTDFNYDKMRYPYKFTHTFNVRGNLQISDGWNIDFSSGYDFENHKISMTTAGLSRDLHCFNMSCRVTLAPYTSYDFSFRCNAATLTDALKYDKRSSYSNAVQWY